MKTTKMKWIGMALWIFTAMAYVGCADDPIDKGTGGNGGNGGADSCCHLVGTVVYLPEGCIVPPQGSRVGIVDDKGNYFYVADDQTGKFKDAKVGDKIRYGATQMDTCYVDFVSTQGGFWAPPIHCITLTCLEITESNNSDCHEPNEVTHDEYEKLGSHFYNVDEFEVTGTRELKLNIWFSGCNQDVDVDMVMEKLPTASIYDHYVAKLDYEETMCAMVIERDLCFDLSHLPQNARLDLETPKGTKTILAP